MRSFMYPRTTATYRSLPRFRKVLDTPPTTSYASDYKLRLLLQVTPPPTTSYASSYYKLRLRLQVTPPTTSYASYYKLRLLRLQVTPPSCRTQTDTTSAATDPSANQIASPGSSRYFLLVAMQDDPLSRFPVSSEPESRHSA